jgi:hypothetical protein
MPILTVRPLSSAVAAFSVGNSANHDANVTTNMIRAFTSVSGQKVPQLSQRFQTPRVVAADAAQQ